MEMFIVAPPKIAFRLRQTGIRAPRAADGSSLCFAYPSCGDRIPPQVPMSALI
jgi:hypothetical protein